MYSRALSIHLLSVVSSFQKVPPNFTHLDETKFIPVDSEDEEVAQSPLKPRLKIKLKLPTIPASSTSNTATPVPEEEKVTPGRRTVAKRSAAVRGRRRIQGILLAPITIISQHRRRH